MMMTTTMMMMVMMGCFGICSSSCSKETAMMFVNFVWAFNTTSVLRAFVFDMFPKTKRTLFEHETSFTCEDKPLTTFCVNILVSSVFVFLNGSLVAFILFRLFSCPVTVRFYACTLCEYIYIYIYIYMFKKQLNSQAQPLASDAPHQACNCMRWYSFKSKFVVRHHFNETNVFGTQNRTIMGNKGFYNHLIS